MKKIACALLICPMLVAMQCDEEEHCGIIDPAPYMVSIENQQESYSVNDTVWLSAEISSKFVDRCDATDSVIVYDAKKFKDGLFMLRMMPPGDDSNSFLAAASLKMVYDEAISAPQESYCLEAPQFYPVLQNDEQQYQYRIGVVAKSAGTFAIAFSSASSFDDETDLNEELLAMFALPDGHVKFNSCGSHFVRMLQYRQVYFFSVL
ncbi:MAG TPA: hypothetical protein VF676_08340 [Flavobacterium sp.]|jgi:hypothetical protein